MINFREVNDDILKEWFDFREETCFCYADKQDRENNIKNRAEEIVLNEIIYV